MAEVKFPSRWMAEDLTLVQVMVLCCKATSTILSQCWSDPCSHMPSLGYNELTIYNMTTSILELDECCGNPWTWQFVTDTLLLYLVWKKLLFWYCIIFIQCNWFYLLWLFFIEFICLSMSWDFTLTWFIKHVVCCWFLYLFIAILMIFVQNISYNCEIKG